MFFKVTFFSNKAEAIIYRHKCSKNVY